MPGKTTYLTDLDAGISDDDFLAIAATDQAAAPGAAAGDADVADSTIDAITGASAPAGFQDDGTGKGPAAKSSSAMLVRDIGTNGAQPVNVFNNLPPDNGLENRAVMADGTPLGVLAAPGNGNTYAYGATGIEWPDTANAQHSGVGPLVASTNVATAATQVPTTTASSSPTSVVAQAATAGAHINLIWDTSVSSAPAGFMTAVQAAANYLSSIITNNITVNIRIGYGEYTNGSGTTTTPIAANTAEGGESAVYWVPTTTLISDLKAAATSSAQITAWNGLSSSLDPNGNGNISVDRSQLKALGISLGGVTANDSGVDGSVGIGTGWDASSWEGVALHEITHAMGRISGYGSYGILDLFRYSASGVHVYAGGSGTQYFSINGGITDLANYSSTSDYGDWNGDALTPFDPFNAFYVAGTDGTQMTAVDKTQLNVIGYNLSSGALTYTVAQAATAYAANANVVPMNIVDTAANVTAGLNQLGTMTTHGNVASITLLDPATAVHATVLQLSSDAAAIAKITGPIGLVVDNAATAFSYTMAANESALTVSGTGTATIVGNALGDRIQATSGSANLTGGSGSDTFIVGAGNDTLIGGGGTNTVDYSTLVTTGITTTLNNGSGSTLKGGANGTDTLTGIQAVTGVSASSIYVLSNGSYHVTGGAGNDIYIVDSNNNTLTEAVAGGFDSVLTTAANTSLGANLEYLQVNANFATGNDINATGTYTLEANGVGDTLTGSTANDIYIVHRSDTVINDTGGTNTIISYAPTYTVSANVGGNAILAVVTDNATGIANNAGDVLIGFGLNDTLIGGTGNDLFEVLSASDVVQEAPGAGFDTIWSESTTYVLPTNVEQLQVLKDGGTGISNAAGGIIIAASHNDILQSGTGNDILYGNGLGVTYTFTGAGFGNDVIAGFTAHSTGSLTADVVDLTAFHLAGLADLTLTAGLSGGVSITTMKINGDPNAADVLTFYGTASNQLAATDFKF